MCSCSVDGRYGLGESVEVRIDEACTCREEPRVWDAIECSVMASARCGVRPARDRNRSGWQVLMHSVVGGVVVTGVIGDVGAFKDCWIERGSDTRFTTVTDEAAENAVGVLELVAVLAGAASAEGHA